jgi:uncharacterized protein YgiB involved in biofilm formation
MKKLTLLALLVAGLFIATGCEQKSDAEKAGDSIKKAASDTADVIEDTAHKAADAVKDATN